MYKDGDWKRNWMSISSYEKFRPGHPHVQRDTVITLSGTGCIRIPDTIAAIQDETNENAKKMNRFFFLQVEVLKITEIIVNGFRLAIDEFTDKRTLRKPLSAMRDL